MKLRRSADEAVLQPYLEGIAASGEYPYLAPLLKAGLPVEETFERGLNWLLDGIERDLAGE
jgi:hypothetical protein